MAERTLAARAPILPRTLPGAPFLRVLCARVGFHNCLVHGILIARCPVKHPQPRHKWNPTLTSKSATLEWGTRLHELARLRIYHRYLLVARLQIATYNHHRSGSFPPSLGRLSASKSTRLEPTRLSHQPEAGLLTRRVWTSSHPVSIRLALFEGFLRWLVY
jgi:hypothetical protein